MSEFNTNETKTTTAAEENAQSEVISSENIDTTEEKTPGIYVHKLRTPFSWEGVTYTGFTLDFNKLTGADLSAVEQEMNSEGKFASSPEFSASYALKLAARAAGVHSIVMTRLPLYEANIIRRETKNFLLNGD